MNTTVSLTEIEKEILTQLANGALVTEIAEYMKINPRDVEYHRLALFKKIPRPTPDTHMSATALLFHFAIGTGIVNCRFQKDDILIITAPNEIKTQHSMPIYTDQEQPKKIRRGNKHKLRFDASKAVQKVLENIKANGGLI